jgi:uncharacterized protein YceH (UPF0502 family)
MGVADRGDGSLRPVDLTDAETRVLGCLVEKQRLTPDAYPLSLNSLRLASNQSTSRDPVVDYDEATIRDALQRLSRRRFARLTSGAGSRAAKYRHLLDEALPLPPGQLELLTVLMLRGAQTPGELRQRSERMHRFADAAAVQQALDGLAERELIVRLERRPGQKEERYAHRLGEDAAGWVPPGEPAASAPTPAAPAATPASAPTPAAAPAAAPQSPPPDDGRLTRLEAEVAELRAEVAALREALGG